MEKQKNKIPPKTQGYKKTHTPSQRGAHPAAIGAKNNDDLNDDKKAPKNAKVAQQLQLWYIHPYKPAKKNQNNNPI